MKIIIAAIAGAIVMFLLSWLSYGVILAKNMAEFGGDIMRSPQDMRMWAIIVGTVLQAFFMSWIYTMTYKGESPLKEGFLFGFFISILMYIPYIFFYWGSNSVRYTLVITDGVLMGIRLTAAAIIIALIIGKKEKAT